MSADTVKLNGAVFCLDIASSRIGGILVIILVGAAVIIFFIKRFSLLKLLLETFLLRWTDAKVPC